VRRGEADPKAEAPPAPKVEADLMRIISRRIIRSNFLWWRRDYKVRRRNWPAVRMLPAARVSGFLAGCGTCVEVKARLARAVKKGQLLM